jgi:DNA-binding XRE family transcriptional regulator
VTESVSAADFVGTRGAGGDLIIMGPPGVGKGTQAKALAQENAWVQLSTGEVFRDHIRRGTDLGRRVKGYLERGEYNPSLELAFKIAELFGVPIEAVFSREPLPPMSARLYGRPDVDAESA